MIPLLPILGAVMSMAPPRPDPNGGIRNALSGLGQLEQENQFQDQLRNRQAEFRTTETRANRQNQEQSNQWWGDFNYRAEEKDRAEVKWALEQIASDPTGKAALWVPEYLKARGFTSEQEAPAPPPGSENWQYTPPVMPATTRDPRQAAIEGHQIRQDAQAAIDSGQPATQDSVSGQDAALAKALPSKLDIWQAFQEWQKQAGAGPQNAENAAKARQEWVNQLQEADRRLGVTSLPPSPTQAAPASEDAQLAELERIRAQNDARDAAEADAPPAQAAEGAPVRGSPSPIPMPGMAGGPGGPSVDLLPLDPSKPTPPPELLPLNPASGPPKQTLLSGPAPRAALPLPGESPDMTLQRGPVRSVSETKKGSMVTPTQPANPNLPAQSARAPQKIVMRGRDGKLLQIDAPSMAAIDAQRAGATAGAIGADIPAIDAEAVKRFLATNPTPEQVQEFFQKNILPNILSRESTKRTEIAAGAKSAGRSESLDFDTGVRAAGRALQDPGVAKTMAMYPEVKRTIGLAQKDPASVSDSVLQRSFAKALNSGALSEADARSPEAYMSWVDRAKAWAYKQFKGQLSPEERAGMLEVLQHNAERIEAEALDSYESDLASLEQMPSPSHQYNRGFVNGMTRIYGKFPFFDKKRVQAAAGGMVAPEPEQTPQAGRKQTQASMRDQKKISMGIPVTTRTPPKTPADSDFDKAFGGP